jgi:hypothetical protein
MRIIRKITPTIALLLALLAAGPATCSASSLLSGYGGPGQGNQAILGSGLVNGPSGGGGGGGPTAGSQTPAVVSTSTANTGSRSAPRSGGHGHRAAGSKHPSAHAGGPSGASGASYQAYERAASTQRGIDSGLLGLSSRDLLLIVLALCALLSTAFIARGLARPHGPRRHAGS